MTTKDTTKKAVGYIRVSTTEQAKEGISLDVQKREIESHCKANGFELVTIFCDDGVSGSIPMNERPAGKQAIEFLRARHADHLMATKLDRCFRDIIDAHTVNEDFQKRNIGLHLFDLNIDTTSINGEIYFGMVALFAKSERRRIGERIKTALNSQRAAGKVYSNAPYGYDAQDGLLKENKQEQKAIRLMRQLRQSDYSYQEIADELSLRDYKPKLADTWSKVAIMKILKREPIPVA